VKQIKFLLAAALALNIVQPGLLPAGEPGAAAPVRPNILLIVIDTLRADHVSAYGYERQTTPNIDKLAKSGVLFSSAYAQSNWTLPSFASFLTGKYPRTLGLFDGKGVSGFAYNDPPLGRSEVTLPEALKKAGYRTAGFFTGRFNGPDYGFDHGFDLYRNYRNRSSDKGGPVKSFSAFLPEAYKWMGADRTKPFFLLLHSSELHRPYRAPESFVKKYAGKYTGVLASTWLSRDVLSTIQKDDKGWSFSPEVSSGKDGRTAAPAKGPATRLLQADMAYIVARYDASLNYADKFVGGIVEKARKAAPEDTIIIVMGDHGEGLGDHGGVLHCTNPPRLYQELIHVPLIISIPEKWQKTAAPVIAQPVELVDLMPTLLELAKAGPAAGLQGKSLNGLLAGGTTPDAASPIYSETLGYGTGMQAVKSGSLKLIRIGVGAGARPKYELYDLAADPSEKNDLATLKPELVKELLAKLDARTAENDKQKKLP
jgi:arylsulfatase A-like enzyme